MAFLLGTVLCVALVGWIAAYRARRRLEIRADLLDRLAAGVRRELPLADLVRNSSYALGGADAATWEALAVDLEAGTSLADAFEHLGRRRMPAHVTGAVRAAEGTSRLADVLESVATGVDAALSLRHRTFLVGLYPLLLAILGLAVHLACVRWLQGEVSSQAGRDGLSPSSSEATAAVALVVASLTIAAVWAVLSRLGLFPGARRLGTARLLDTAALLLDAGLSPVEAFRRAAPATGHRGLERRVVAAADDVHQGDSLPRLWSALRLRAVDRLRLRAEGQGLAATLREVSGHALVRWQERSDTGLRLVGPLAVLVVGALVFIDFSIVFGILEEARDVAQPW